MTPDNSSSPDQGTARSPLNPTHRPVAVVTGASGGLGSALTSLLITRGWSVVGIDHNTSRMRALTESLPDGSFMPLVHDLASPDLTDFLHASLRGWPPPTALACVAGVSIGDAIERLDDTDWNLSFSINTTSPMILARALTPAMAALGRGSIVNVGSPVGIVGARKPSYAASKAALTGLTISLARNLGPKGIRANLFLPGPMLTPMTQDWSDEKRASIAERTFLRRLCKPEEAAQTIAFLLSEESSYLTGSIIDGTGGSMFGH